MPHCIACSNWTLKPRADEPALADKDRARAAIGWGRCQLDTLSERWFAGQGVVERQCDRYVPLPADQVQARHGWLAKQKGQV